MTPPTPPVPSCPLLDAECVEAGATAAHRVATARTSNNRSIRTSRAVLTAAVAALDRDALAVLIEDAIADETNADDGLTTYAQLARAVLAVIGLLPAEHKEETG